MSLVTYILLVALHSGLHQRFHPRVLGESASRALAVLLVDFFFVKSGCYFLNVQGTGQVVDLIAYGGYKFVGCVHAFYSLYQTSLMLLKRCIDPDCRLPECRKYNLRHRILVFLLCKRTLPSASLPCSF
jgi:hypothetical protein